MRNKRHKHFNARSTSSPVNFLSLKIVAAVISCEQIVPGRHTPYFSVCSNIHNHTKKSNILHQTSSIKHPFTKQSWQKMTKKITNFETSTVPHTFTYVYFFFFFLFFLLNTHYQWQLNPLTKQINENFDIKGKKIECEKWNPGKPGSSAKIGTIQRRLAWPLRKDDLNKVR